MQPKRTINYRILTELGISIEFSYGIENTCATVKLIRSHIGTTISAIQLYKRGKRISSAISEALSVSALRYQEPDLVNAKIWEELKRVYNEFKEAVNPVIESIPSSTRLKIEEYGKIQRLTAEEIELLVLHSGAINAALAASVEEVNDPKQGEFDYE